MALRLGGSDRSDLMMMLFFFEGSCLVLLILGARFSGFDVGGCSDVFD